MKASATTWQRSAITLICGSVLALACGGKSTGGTGGSAGTAGACDDYFTQVYLVCDDDTRFSLEPASEVARVQGRFATLCAEEVSLPGVSVTPSALEACVAAVKASGCSGASAACTFGAPGALPAGSVCEASEQCQGYCNAGDGLADGGFSPCGTCVTPAATGQPCTVEQGCGPNDLCTGGICAAITRVGAGASCASQLTECNPGLVCGQSSTCFAPGGQGTACADDTECALPLACASASQTCQSPGGAGTSCESDIDCTQDLGCDSTTHVCAAITFVTAGQSCSGAVRCVVGACNVPNGTGLPGSTTGTCPTVIADGQPCNEADQSQTCDTLASCQQGTCTLGNPACP
jgi:hypothetical protein